MLLSPETVEFTKTINPPYCTVCYVNHPEGKHITLDEVKKNALQHVLKETGGNKMQAAKILDINIRTVQRLCHRFE